MVIHMTIHHNLKEYYDNCNKKVQASVLKSVDKINLLPTLPNNLPNLINQHKKSLGNISLDKYVKLHSLLCPNNDIPKDTFVNYVNKGQRPGIERLNHLIDFLNIDRLSSNDFSLLKPSKLLRYTNTFFNSPKDIDAYLEKIRQNLELTAHAIDDINKVLLKNDSEELSRLSELKELPHIKPLGIEKIRLIEKKVENLKYTQRLHSHNSYRSLYPHDTEDDWELNNLDINQTSATDFFEKIISKKMKSNKTLQKIKGELNSLNEEFQITLESKRYPDEFDIRFNEQTLLFEAFLDLIA